MVRCTDSSIIIELYTGQQSLTELYNLQTALIETLQMWIEKINVSPEATQHLLSISKLLSATMLNELQLSAIDYSIEHLPDTLKTAFVTTFSIQQ